MNHGDCMETLELYGYSMDKSLDQVEVFQQTIELISLNTRGLYYWTNWAIKNTTIPSHFTSWLRGFPTMGYNDPQ